MRNIFLLLFLPLLCAVPLAGQTIYTSEKDFRGHLQGIAVDESGISCSFAHDMMKVDFQGKVLRRFHTPSHAGDMTTDGERIYCAVSMWYAKDAEKFGANNCIFVYDREFKFLEAKPFKDLQGFDGIAYINGKFYVGLNDLGSKARMENRIAILDRDFKLLKIATITIGSKTKFGAQTLNNFNGKLLAGFYGGGKSSYIFDPDELEKSDTVVKPVGQFPADTTVGFFQLPDTIAEPGSFIIARNFRAIEPVSKKRRYGAKFIVQKQNRNGSLKLSSLKIAK